MAFKNMMKQKRDRRLQKRLSAYSVAASAALALANPAEASIVYSGAKNILIETGFEPSGYWNIDIDGGGTYDFRFSFNRLINGHVANSWYSATHHFSIRGLTTQAQVATGSPYWGSGWAKNFIQSGSIPGANPTWAAWHPNKGPNLHVDNGYMTISSDVFTGFGLHGPFHDTGLIGIKFNIGANQHYGFIEYAGLNDEHDVGRGSFGLILGWAYESTPGATIIAGAVPLPGTFGLGLLSLGAAGVARLRQRKKEIKEKKMPR